MCGGTDWYVGAIVGGAYPRQPAPLIGSDWEEKKLKELQSMTTNLRECHPARPF